MSKSKNVISRKNLPVKSPITAIILYLFLMDYYNAPGWAWGAVGLLFLVMIIVWLIELLNEKHIDIFSDNEITSEKKKQFQDKINDLQNKNT